MRTRERKEIRVRLREVRGMDRAKRAAWGVAASEKLQSQGKEGGRRRVCWEGERGGRSQWILLILFSGNICKSVGKRKKKFYSEHGPQLCF